MLVLAQAALCVSDCWGCSQSLPVWCWSERLTNRIVGSTNSKPVRVFQSLASLHYPTASYASLCCILLIFLTIFFSSFCPWPELCSWPFFFSDINSSEEKEATLVAVELNVDPGGGVRGFICRCSKLRACVNCRICGGQTGCFLLVTEWWDLPVKSRVGGINEHCYCTILSERHTDSHKHIIH